MNPKLHKIYGLIIKLFVLFASFGFIYYQISSKENISSILGFFESKLLSKPSFNYLVVIILSLMLINWGFEAIKWRYLVSKIESLGFIKAFKAVIAGVTVSIFTPNKTGEFAGRILSIEKASRWEAILITFIGSISQLIVTLFMGCVAILFFIFIFDFDIPHLSNYLRLGFLLFCIIVLFLMIILYFNIGIVAWYFKKLKSRYFRNIVRYVQVFRMYSKKELFNVLLLSVMRYLIFSLQLVLILIFFEIDIVIIHLVGITFTWFLIITIVPTVALTEIGVRGAASVFLFDTYFNNIGTNIVVPQYELKVIAASFLLWIINIIIPAIMGSVFILQFNIFKKS